MQEKRFTVHIVNNETNEDRTIHTNAIIAGMEEKSGASRIVMTHGSIVDVCAACEMALEAVDYVFNEDPFIRELVTEKREKDTKEQEGEDNE